MQTSSTTSRLAPSQGELVIELASASYSHGTHDALVDACMTIRAHEVVALVGPNGSGKSTALELLAGTLVPRSGTVRRHGGGGVAFVVQRARVADTLPITVREVVAMGRWAHAGAWRPLRRADHEAVGEALDRVGIARLALTSIARLSGGQRQRALLAQGLVQDARLLLLDEPEAGLDVDTRGIVRSVLHDQAQRGTAVVLATHDEDSIACATRVVRLESGRVVP